MSNLPWNVAICLLIALSDSVFCYSSSNHGGSSSSNSNNRGSGSNGPIQASITTRHSVQMRDVPLEPMRSNGPGTIEVKSENVPSFFIKFNSQSSRVNLIHEHEAAPKKPNSAETFSEDEPHIMRHRVEKPVIQEVREIISPFRRIIQEIEPVKEEIKTIVAKSSNDAQRGSTKPSFNFHMTMPGGKQFTVNSGKNNDQNKPTANSLVTSHHQQRQQHHEQSHQPDLEISDAEWVDLSLYNGNSIMETKYVSTTDDAKVSDIAHHKYQLYKDRR